MRDEAPRGPATSWRPPAVALRGVAGRGGAAMPEAARAARRFVQGLRRRQTALPWRGAMAWMQTLPQPRAAISRFPAARVTHWHLNPVLRFVLASAGGREARSERQAALPAAAPPPAMASAVPSTRLHEVLREIRTRTTRLEHRLTGPAMRHASALPATGEARKPVRRPVPEAWARPLSMPVARQPAAASPQPRPPLPAPPAPPPAEPRLNALPATPWPNAALPLGRAQVERLTEEVMRGIDRRFVALRERLGRG